MNRLKLETHALNEDEATGDSSEKGTIWTMLFLVRWELLVISIYLRTILV